MQLAEVAAEVDRADLRSDSDRKSMGRPVESGSDQRVADRLGISKTNIVEARQHVAAIEKYPELESKPQSEALRIASRLDEIPEPEERQEALAALQAQEASRSRQERAAVALDLRAAQIAVLADQIVNGWLIGHRFVVCSGPRHQSRRTQYRHR